MTGLRANQKAERRRRILEAATKLFQSAGYDAARIEDIAEIAGISAGTFYNYFENKGDILLATVAMEVEEVLQYGQSIINAPPADVLTALQQLIDCYTDHSLFYVTKEMWRTAMALSIQQPSSPFSRRYTELDTQLRSQVGTLIGTMQARGRVRTDIDCKSIGAVMFNNLNQMFTEFVKADGMSLEELREKLKQQTGPIARLLEVDQPSRV
jgi:AcrR family transcriptional regulator